MKKFIIVVFLLFFPTIFITERLFEALYGVSIPREIGDRGLWELAVTMLWGFNLCLSFIIAFIVFSLLNIVVIKFFPNKVVIWLQEWQEKSEKSQWTIIWLGSIICYFVLLPPLATQTILLVHGSSSESGSKYKLYEKREGEAEFLEGIKFYEGTDVEKNMDEAFKWFKKAGENRHKGAQFYLGLMHFNGVGAEKNYEEAFRWYLLSANNGSAAAQNNVGLMYHYGYGVETNTIEALKWYTRAAEGGTDTAYKNLGIIYYEGAVGVNKNYIKSFIWSTMAQNSGLDRLDFLTHLRTKMPDWHAEKAEVLAEKCWKHKRHINPMQYCTE